MKAKPATLLKVTVLHGCFSRFLNCTNGTKSRNASQIFIHKLFNISFLLYHFFLTKNIDSNSSKTVILHKGTILALSRGVTHLFPMHPFSSPWKHQKTATSRSIQPRCTKRFKRSPAKKNFLNFLLLVINTCKGSATKDDT